MSNFYDPNTDNILPKGSEGLKIMLSKCSDVRSRIKIYELLESKYTFWKQHSTEFTKREYYEDIVKNESFEKWVEKMFYHMQCLINIEYLYFRNIFS